MYFKDLNFQSVVATDNQRRFIKELSEMLEHYAPPLIALYMAKITLEVDKNEEYLKVSLPHKNDESFNLWVAVYDIEVIVFFGDAHQHFEKYGEGNEWIIEAITFILEILKGKLVIHTFYKGDKNIKVKMYFINENGEKELISICSYLNFTFFNPFLKVKEEIQMISFFS